MLIYLYVAFFLVTSDLSRLKEFWSIEFIHSKFSWLKIISRIIKNEDENYYFWWRIANEMYLYGNNKQKRKARRLNIILIHKYNVDIQMGAKIGKGLHIPHFMAIQISCCAEIGKNFTCNQMVNIAFNKNPCKIKIGDNVSVGCGSVILGGDINIGNNVKIGAMSFINNDIPDNCTVITEKTNRIIVA